MLRKKPALCGLFLNKGISMTQFEIEDNVLKYCKLTNEETEVIIPDGVRIIGGSAFHSHDSLEKIVLPNGVEAIGDLAFAYCENLKYIYFPEGLKRIEKDAFNGCSKLESITLPDSVEFIGDRCFCRCTGLKFIKLSAQLRVIPMDAFEHCQNLQKIILPEGLQTIKYSAFNDCKKLRTISFPKSLDTILENYILFGGCSALESIIVDEDSSSYKSIDGILYSRDCSELICFPQNHPFRYYSVPAGVKNIRMYAFSNCTHLKSITLPDGLQKIEIGAFKKCSNLKQITFGDGLKTIENYVFLGCKKLQNLEIPGSVQNISEQTFDECPAAISIIQSNFDNYYKSIDGTVFTGDGKKLLKYPVTSIESEYIVPDSVIEIGAYAFNNCRNLKNVILPLNLQKIRKNAFHGCSGIQSIKFPDEIVKIDEVSFEKCTNLEEIILPKKLRSIERFAFSECKNLKSIHFPENLISIGFHSFDDCTGLEGVIVLPESVRYIDEGVFWGCNKVRYVEWPIVESEIPYANNIIRFILDIPFFLPNCSPRNLHNYDFLNAFLGFIAALADGKTLREEIYEDYKNRIIDYLEDQAKSDENPKLFAKIANTHDGVTAWMIKEDILNPEKKKYITDWKGRIHKNPYAQKFEDYINKLQKLLLKNKE